MVHLPARASDYGPPDEPQEEEHYARARCATCGRFCPGRPRYGQPPTCGRCASAWLRRYHEEKQSCAS